MSLKDGAGTVKQFAMVDISSYQNVAVGDTVAATQASYEALLVANGVELEDTEVDTSTLKSVTGTIVRIAQGVLDGNSHFYVTIEGSDEIFDFALPSLVDIVGYDVGDSITFTYIEGDTTATVQSFGDTTADADSSTDSDESSASDESDAESDASSSS